MMFRTLSDRTTGHLVSLRVQGPSDCTTTLTLIFANVFQRESQAGILALYDPHLSERTLPYYPKESEMIQIYYEQICC